MENLYNKNGLVFWNQKEIEYREICEKEISRVIYENLKSQNKGFEMIKIEASQLTPNELINKEYNKEDYFSIGDLSLRPETTVGSYIYAAELLKGGYGNIKYSAPLIIYQHGKSFRNEQDKTIKNMRLKEFYQLEFQIIFYENTAVDYSETLFEEVRKTLSKILSSPCRLEVSDRLPKYSEQTIDVVLEENNMEVCSMSKRNDFPIVNGNRFKVIEVAIGTDRLIYNYMK